jgi:hypothetical protein
VQPNGRNGFTKIRDPLPVNKKQVCPSHCTESPLLGVWAFEDVTPEAKTVPSVANKPAPA